MLDFGSAAWWLLKPFWMSAYALLLVPLLGLFGRFERFPGPSRPLAPWRLVAGAVLLCAGLGRMALIGIAGPGGPATRFGALPSSSRPCVFSNRVACWS